MATTNENVITVEVSKRTPKKKTAVMERLENSPRKALTPEILKSRQLAADERRQVFFFFSIHIIVVSSTISYHVLVYREPEGGQGSPAPRACEEYEPQASDGERKLASFQPGEGKLIS
jgi:hypothetical protein